MRLLLTCAILVLLSACTGNPEAKPVASPAVSEAVTTTMQFAIDEMTCPACTNAVYRAVDGKSGITSCSVDLESKTATVQFDPGTVTPDDIITWIGETHRTATPITQPGGP